MLCEKCQHRRLFRTEASRLRRHARLRQPPTARQLPQDRPPFPQRHGQRRLHHLADRVLVIAGGEAQQGELRGIEQRRAVQHRLNRFQPVAAIHRRYRQHHADDAVPSERHPHPRPDCNGFGAEIIKTSGQRARHGDTDSMRGSHWRSLKSAWLTCLVIGVYPSHREKIFRKPQTIPPPACGRRGTHEKMPAFFSWVPGRCRAATEEGEKTCLSNFAWFVLRTNALTPPPLPQAGERFSFIPTAIFTTFEMGRHLCPLGGVCPVHKCALLHWRWREVG